MVETVIAQAIALVRTELEHRALETVLGVTLWITL